MAQASACRRLDSRAPSRVDLETGGLVHVRTIGREKLVKSGRVWQLEVHSTRECLCWLLGSLGSMHRHRGRAGRELCWFRGVSTDMGNRFFFLTREVFFSRVSAKFFFVTFFWRFLVFLLFVGGVFVLLGGVFLFFARSAKNFLGFFSAPP